LTLPLPRRVAIALHVLRHYIHPNLNLPTDGVLQLGALGVVEAVGDVCRH